MNHALQTVWPAMVHLALLDVAQLLALGPPSRLVKGNTVPRFVQHLIKGAAGCQSLFGYRPPAAVRDGMEMITNGEGEWSSIVSGLDIQKQALPF